MAQIEDNSGGRETNVELNLVPFIDLMSVCIIFLLITAVWTQVSMIQIGSSIYGKKSERNLEEPPPPQEKTTYRLAIKANGYVLRVGDQVRTIPKRGTEYDTETLINILKAFREKRPDDDSAIISMEETLKYDFLIRGMDAMMTGGFTNLAVSTGDGG